MEFPEASKFHDIRVVAKNCEIMYYEMLQNPPVRPKKSTDAEWLVEQINLTVKHQLRANRAERKVAELEAKLDKKKIRE